MRINGTKEAERRMASLLASLYDSDAIPTRSDSLLSAVNDLIVVIPWRLLFNKEFNSPTSSRTFLYLTPILLWKINEPMTIIGTGITANKATSGAKINIIVPTTVIVVASCSKSLAP